MPRPPSGFAFATTGPEVTITHHGQHATVLRGRAAMDFLEDVEPRTRKS